MDDSRRESRMTAPPSFNRAGREVAASGDGRRDAFLDLLVACGGQGWRRGLAIEDCQLIFLQHGVAAPITVDHADHADRVPAEDRLVEGQRLGCPVVPC